VETISFARGVPAPECLAVQELAQCAKAVLERDGMRVLNYGPAGGYAPLREWLAERHGVEAGRIVLTNGSLQGLALLAGQLLVDRPTRVLVEGPTYDRLLRIVAGLGAEATAIPLTDEGLDLEALEGELRGGSKPAFLYTIPTFQNPSGRTLPLEARLRLLELARRHGVPVVEDDPYRLVRFEGEPLPTLFELAEGTGVVHAASFSKVLAPGLRVGYFILPAVLSRALEEAATRTYLAPSFLAQATVWEFLSRDLFEVNLERIRALLRERRDAMLSALERDVADGASWSRPEGGYFLWLDLPPAVKAAELVPRAEQAGVTLISGTDFYPGGAGGEAAARLAYSFAAPSRIEEGVARLASLLPTRQPAAPAA
jgi:2-aminoadipate transaminase